MKLHILLFVLTIWSSSVHGWDSVEMEVFDVVEEVNQNFYELMGISPVSFDVHAMIVILANSLRFVGGLVSLCRCFGGNCYL